MNDEQPLDFSASLVMIVGAWIAVGQVLKDGFANIEHKLAEGHLKRERLAAYRRRHRWKQSDVRHLLTIGVNVPAQHRMARLTKVGRPIVPAHRPLDQILLDAVRAVSPLFDDNASESDRRKSFPHWPFAKHHIEALYRGELENCRSRRVRSPADEAERLVGKAVGMSASHVHQICTEIRKIRKGDPEQANHPPMRVYEFDRWMCGDTTVLDEISDRGKQLNEQK